MDLESFHKTILPAIEEELEQVVALVNGDRLEGLHEIMAYHLGWSGEGSGPAARGKRVRPLLVLLSNAAAGGDWRQALPAAAAVELIHNFSLLHDDIEDNSPLRRGRATVWTQWGIPLAINAGDAMFTLAHLALLRLRGSLPAEVVLQATQVLQDTCLKLTQGQHLDMSYEDQNQLSMDDYWPMVGGKTAALLSACTELGALVAGVDARQLLAYRKFGELLGLAFQAQDDLLGIWGDAAETGKSAESDLVEGKKSLPVLFGLEQKGAFAARWLHGPVPAEQVAQVAAQLEAEGARQFTEDTASRLTREALDALEQAAPQGEAGQALKNLAVKLIGRKG